MPEEKTPTAYQFRFDCVDKENPINSLTFLIVCQAKSEEEALLITRRKFASTIIDINNRLQAIKNPESVNIISDEKAEK